MQKNTKTLTATERDARWRRVLKRDAKADGTFVYAVKTTGVYCRPSCAARTAKPENVRFYTTCAQAEAAGFRACRRCHPQGPSPAQAKAALVAEACLRLAEAETPPKLAALAASLGMSPFHFHRQFKAIMGVTPKAYASAQRAARVRTQLTDSASVTQAIYGAGFNASSRFYAQSNQLLGMTPTSFKGGGQDARIHFAIGQCSLGAILVACSERGVCAITLGDDPERLVQELQQRFARAELIGADRSFEALVAQVVGLVEAPQHGVELPLDLRGTAFQHRVWQALRAIPVGTTVSYAELARRIGEPRAARAVAQACGQNPVAVAIPCHRVVRNDGALSGYRWGVERKRLLLEREAQS